GVRQFLLKNMYIQDNGKYAYRFNLKTLTDDYTEMVGKDLTDGHFEKPTLFIRGEKSNYILDEDFELIKAHFPQAQIKTIANSGHWLHAENPKMFFSTV